MKAVSGFTIETASYGFELTYFRNRARHPRFVARFIGASRPAQSDPAERVHAADTFPAGTLEGFYLDKLVLQCRAAIDRIDGPILRMLPRRVKRKNPLEC